jgi:CBS domain-containing protein
MRISRLLAAKGSSVATIPPTADLASLVELLAERGIGAAVVSSDGHTVEGIVSERDIVRRLYRDGVACYVAPVSDLMTTAVHTAAPDALVMDLARLMTDRRIRHVPVLDNGRLVGIVSIGDVVKSRIDELEDEQAHVADYLAGSR